MSTAARALDALAELEQRYDGPIPEPLWRLARFGSIKPLRLMEAESQAAFFTRLARDQHAALRHARRVGLVPTGLTHDLALYRRRRRWWRRKAARLRGDGPEKRAPGAVTRSAGDVP